MKPGGDADGIRRVDCFNRLAGGNIAEHWQLVEIFSRGGGLGLAQSNASFFLMHRLDQSGIDQRRDLFVHGAPGTEFHGAAEFCQRGWMLEAIFVVQQEFIDLLLAACKIDRHRYSLFVLLSTSMEQRKNKIKWSFCQVIMPVSCHRCGGNTQSILHPAFLL